MIKKCPVCSGNNFKKIFSTDKIPEYALNYQNNFYDALNYKTVKINFVECNDCGFLFNKINNQLSYKTQYDANRSFSKKFDQYLNNVISFLETNIFKKNTVNNILEIGFGDGIFLKKLSELKKYNFKKILGFDPSTNLSKKNKIKKIRLFKKYYTRKDIVKPDLVILRHTLEHISDVRNFIKLLLHEKPKFLFIEVPCKSFVYKGNIHYYSNEHCSYFDYYSLQFLLKDLGYKTVNIKKVFNGENLIAIFTKSEEKINLLKNPKSPIPKYNLSDIQNKIFKNFNFKYDFLWGAAGKGVTLLNVLNINYKKVPYIIDVNKNIQGKFICLAGTEIISPNSLSKYVHKKSKIFVMNKVYRNEIKNILSRLKLKNKVFVLFSN